MKTPKENKNVLAFSGEFPHFAYFREGRWYEIHTHELLKGITHWEEIPQMKNTPIGMSSMTKSITVGEMNPLGTNALKPKTAIDQAIDEIHQEITNSKNPNALTKRGEEYRIGLQKAIVILMGLREVEKEQIMKAHGDEISYLHDDGSWKNLNGEQYYNETYGGNK